LILRVLAYLALAAFWIGVGYAAWLGFMSVPVHF